MADGDDKQQAPGPSRQVEPRVLKGFRDYLPAKMIPRQRMVKTIEEVFQRHGFVPLMTPALEYADILLGKYGDEGESLIYRFLDNGGRDVALRYDLTVPLARVIAQHPALNLPFRRYQVAPVWRAENPARGRFREFVQCDADIVGSHDMVADAEIVLVACSLLDALGVNAYRVQLSNRKVLGGLMKKVGVEPGSPQEIGVLRTIDKLPKIGREKTERLLADENGLAAEQVAAVFEFLALRGDAAAKLAHLTRYFGEEEPGRGGTSELRQIFDVVDATGLGSRVDLELSIARGLTYYTGTIYEAFLNDLPGFGAVMGGGRYDGLIGVFKGSDVPSVGISLGIDRLLEGLTELKLLEEASSVSQAMVAFFESTAPQAARVAGIVRGAGIPCELFPALAKIKKQFRHAERLGVRWVLVVGEEEVEKGLVKVKDMESRRQDDVAESSLAEYLTQRQAGGS